MPTAPMALKNKFNVRTNILDHDLAYLFVCFKQINIIYYVSEIFSRYGAVRVKLDGLSIADRLVCHVAKMIGHLARQAGQTIRAKLANDAIQYRCRPPVLVQRNEFE